MRVLALDVGERRIGVAAGDPDGCLAVPVETLHRRSFQEDAAAIARLVAREEAAAVLVGLPLSLDGSEGPQARSVRDFAARLQEELGLTIEFWDERFSSVQADGLLRERPRSRRSRAEQDALAATIILQDYLDSKKGGA